MTKRLQVLFDDEEYWALQQSAQENRMTVAEWVRQSLRQALVRQRGVVDNKLRALEKACHHEFPTADIDPMLEEIERGYQKR